MADVRIQIKGGVAANRPTTGMLAREPVFSTDRHTLDVALDATTRAHVVPETDALTAMGTVAGATDLLIIHDADASGVKEKKITIDELATALEISAGGSDEKVAVVSGGTPGFLWGTTGSDGVLRTGASLSITKDESNGFITLDVATLDCGTF